MTKSQKEKQPSIAPVVAALEELFNKFNRDIFESSLSKVVITLSRTGRSKCFGWFSVNKVWQDNNEDYHEINICPEYLSRPIEEICETIIHEQCHFYNAQRGIKDCSRSGQYHNKNFKQCAEQHGLNVEKCSSRGFAKTSLKKETAEYINSLDLKAFEMYRMELPKDRQEKKSSTRKFVCPKCGAIMRVTRKTAKYKCYENNCGCFVVEI